jgi:hypothetical protein
MLGNALILQPLAQTADSNAGGLPDRSITVLETSLNNWPDVAHQRRHELAAALHGNAKCKHCATAIVRVRRSKVMGNECTESREDLGRGKVRGEAVDDAESRLM